MDIPCSSPQVTDISPPRAGPSAEDHFLGVPDLVLRSVGEGPFLGCPRTASHHLKGRFLGVPDLVLPDIPIPDIPIPLRGFLGCPETAKLFPKLFLDLQITLSFMGVPILLPNTALPNTALQISCYPSLKIRTSSSLSLFIAAEASSESLICKSKSFP